MDELTTALSNLVVGIVLASGVYKLSGTLTISYSVIIEAEVPGSVVLDAQGSASTERLVFNVQGGGAAELIGLNVTGGYTSVCSPSARPSGIFPPSPR